MVCVTNSDEVDISNRRYVTWEPDTDDDVMTPANLAHNRDILDFVSRYLPSDGTILDYGSGYCGFLRVAKLAGYSVEGINPCLYLANWARDKLDIQVHAVFGQDFEPGRQFDLVVTDQTFEHLENPLKDLEKIHALLKKNGMVYINVPNLHNFRRILRGVDCLKDISHYNYFTPTTLADLSRRAGFRVVTIAPTIGSGILKRTLKSVLDRLGVGDCSVLLQKQGTT
jgi:SAM-dependent methyltransferase